MVVILARLQSKVRYRKSEKARLVAVAVAVFAVIKEAQVTALFPVLLFSVFRFKNSKGPTPTIRQRAP